MNSHHVHGRQHSAAAVAQFEVLLLRESDLSAVDRMLMLHNSLGDSGRLKHDEAKPPWLSGFSAIAHKSFLDDPIILHRLAIDIIGFAILQHECSCGIRIQAAVPSQKEQILLYGTTVCRNRLKQTTVSDAKTTARKGGKESNTSKYALSRWSVVSQLCMLEETVSALAVHPCPSEQINPRHSHNNALHTATHMREWMALTQATETCVSDTQTTPLHWPTTSPRLPRPHLTAPGSHLSSNMLLHGTRNIQYPVFHTLGKLTFVVCACGSRLGENRHYALLNRCESYQPTDEHFTTLLAHALLISTVLIHVSE
jgi:hypothetical protein